MFDFNTQSPFRSLVHVKPLQPSAFSQNSQHSSFGARIETSDSPTNSLFSYRTGQEVSKSLAKIIMSYKNQNGWGSIRAVTVFGKFMKNGASFVVEINSESL
jgi:hypothetical protein